MDTIWHGESLSRSYFEEKLGVVSSYDRSSDLLGALDNTAWKIGVGNIRPGGHHHITRVHRTTTNDDDSDWRRHGQARAVNY